MIASNLLPRVGNLLPCAVICYYDSVIYYWGHNLILLSRYGRFSIYKCCYVNGNLLLWIMIDAIVDYDNLSEYNYKRGYEKERYDMRIYGWEVNFMKVWF